MTPVHVDKALGIMRTAITSALFTWGRDGTKGEESYLACVALDNVLLRNLRFGYL